MSPSSDDAALGRALRPRGPVQLDVSARREAGAAVLACRGELDVLTIPKLATRFDDILRRAIGDVVVDLRETSFIDSMGLHFLLGAQRRLARQSRRLVVICGPGPVRALIELTRLVDALGVLSSFSEYLASC